MLKGAIKVGSEPIRFVFKEEESSNFSPFSQKGRSMWAHSDKVSWRQSNMTPSELSQFWHMN